MNKTNNIFSLNKRLILILGITIGLVMLFLFYDLKGNIQYILGRRLTIVAAMVIIAAATSLSTVAFQTVTHNRILSPAVMGFEYLFIFIQSCLIFFWGEAGIFTLSPVNKFLIETVAMILFSNILYYWLFNFKQGNLFIILLVGIVLGRFFDSLSSLAQRLLNPNEFAILQSQMFASFNSINDQLLVISAIIICLAGFCIWKLKFRLDVLSLGKENATALGVEYKKTISILLMLISLLVSISTALIGPMTFLGFLIASLAYQVMPTYRHKYLLPTAFLIGIIALLGGQFILQHLFKMNGNFSIVINFIGGTFFIVLLLRKKTL